VVGGTVVGVDEVVVVGGTVVVVDEVVVVDGTVVVVVLEAIVTTKKPPTFCPLTWSGAESPT